MEKVYVYIDGGNLYWNLKEIGVADMNFDFKSFIDSFVRERTLAGIRYYIGQIHPEDGNEQSQKLHRLQQILFSKLKNLGFYIDCTR